MVKKAAVNSTYDIEKPLTSAAAAGRSSISPSTHSVRKNEDEDMIVSLANAYENKRARQVSEWERAQSTRWPRAV